jgi:hypothetical protein
MTRLDVDIDPIIDRRFRGAVYRRLGMKRGNLSTAVEEALKIWVKKDDGPKNEQPKSKQAPELLASASAS